MLKFKETILKTSMEDICFTYVKISQDVSGLPTFPIKMYPLESFFGLSGISAAEKVQETQTKQKTLLSQKSFLLTSRVSGVLQSVT